MFTSVTTAALGFPRMGPKRELKFALEKYWKNSIDRTELIRVAQTIEEISWQLQKDAGIDRISVGDFALYDNVVQWVERLGLVPERFSKMESGMDRMFAMSRGVEGATALSKYMYSIVSCQLTSTQLVYFTLNKSNVFSF